MSTPLKHFLVTGKDGQLGKSLQKVAQNQSPVNLQLTFWGREQLDLTDLSTLQKTLKSSDFDGIINCAAYTAVDLAETESDLADLINHRAVALMAEHCAEQGIPLVHISTDYVFDGHQTGAYREHDLTNPINQYGASKLKGEQAIQSTDSPGCIIRTSWVHSPFGKNFVKTMLRLGESKPQLDVVFDQIGSPTYAPHLAKAILHMLEHPTFSKCQGDVFHFSNEGVTSWYDLAYTIFEHKLTPLTFLTAISTDQFPTPATRPLYTVMDKRKFCQQFDYTIPNWREGLEQCLASLNY
ncbi:MAG: dTDP-4-dehydrorhamnose reductase [Hydrogenovibrio sp.]|uniref:dTDP-4-dehydrorhamnose reductase n=1 Tax=Hydrogenovibrio sp. TaxID=2065821 RepID=UPI0028706385|nr:dTDP-4-dehydrorhamnose reductase [Hydrogenovibrio sp.]MDR9499913.1 dTDP-4-dehydrorhamnose reductase [Hydrogenovibrio sp.]